MPGSFIRHGLNQEETTVEALQLVLAGNDTSATIIRSMILGLLTNPGADSKLQKEIDSGVAVGGDQGRAADFAARSRPTFKTVPQGGGVIAGGFIPRGTRMGNSPFGIHHVKRTFGADAGHFVLERWFVANVARLAEMTSTADLIFHSGKYQCLHLCRVAPELSIQKKGLSSITLGRQNPDPERSAASARRYRIMPTTRYATGCSWTKSRGNSMHVAIPYMHRLRNLVAQQDGTWTPANQNLTEEERQSMTSKSGKSKSSCKRSSGGGSSKSSKGSSSKDSSKHSKHRSSKK
ncbi:hypothetical protein DL767_008397 [Monosporascus sp. MG133]|nr:hypothetical protein DL767_008397 [Monosporascus sp. MG133]